MDVPGFEERGRQTGASSRRWTEAMRTHRAAAACGGLNQSIPNANGTNLSVYLDARSAAPPPYCRRGGGKSWRAMEQ